MTDISTISKIIIAIFVVGALFGSYMAFIEPFKLRVTEHVIKTPKWPYEQPIKIALLADPHMIWPWMTKDHLADIVQRTNALEPDLILLLGDYVGDHMFGKQLYAPDAIKPFEDLRAPCGVYGVLGNHDMRKKDNHISDWSKAMDESSVPMLNNMATNILCKGNKISVAGIEDWWYGEADIDKALSGIDAGIPTIFMTHNPDAFPLIPEQVTLSVAGHTHGGQVRFPFIGALSHVVPSKYGDKYAYGHIRENGKDLFVSAGLGMTGLPIRFLNPPEIAIVTVQKE